MNRQLGKKEVRVFFEGTLFKAGYYNTSFKKRYCVLLEKEMLYYKDEKSFRRNQKPRGIIPLSRYDVRGKIKDNAKIYTKPFFALRPVRSKYRWYLFRAETEEEKRQWIAGLKEITAQIQGINLPASPSPDVKRSPKEAKPHRIKGDPELKAQLEEFLDIPDFQRLFSDYCETKPEAATLEFLIESKNLDQKNDAAFRVQAIEIYEEFINSESRNCILFHEPVEYLEDLITEGRFRHDMFDVYKEEAADALCPVFSSFQATQIYKDATEKQMKRFYDAFEE